MTWDISKLKGHTVVDTREDITGNETATLIFDDGTELCGFDGIGYNLPNCEECNAVLSVAERATWRNKCGPCLDNLRRQEEEERARRMANEREIAMADTPTLAALRRQLET